MNGPVSKGIYNESYFKNHPDEADIEATLYCVVLVNKQTLQRECIKIGITKGRDWKAVLKRASGFRFHDVRIQKTVVGRLEDIYYLEQYLHELWEEEKYVSPQKFGGHTELFNMNDDIIKSIPKNV